MLTAYKHKTKQKNNSDNKHSFKIVLYTMCSGSTRLYCSCHVLQMCQIIQHSPCAVEMLDYTAQTMYSRNVIGCSDHALQMCQIILLRPCSPDVPDPTALVIVRVMFERNLYNHGEVSFPIQKES